MHRQQKKKTDMYHENVPNSACIHLDVEQAKATNKLQWSKDKPQVPLQTYSRQLSSHENDETFFLGGTSS